MTIENKMAAKEALMLRIEYLNSVNIPYLIEEIKRQTERLPILEENFKVYIESVKAEINRHEEYKASAILEISLLQKELKNFTD